MHIVLTGGGTGGHVYPALAIAEALHDAGHTVSYIGTEEGVEASILEHTSIPFYTIKAASLPRKPSPALLRSLGTNLQGLRAANKLMHALKPDLVLGTGGFVCGTVVLSAQRLGIPTMLHEQNATPGLTNRLLAKKAKLVCLTFKEAKSLFPSHTTCVWTGLPVRSSVCGCTKEEGRAFYHLDSEKITILVTGGSRGARSLNIATIAALPSLLERGDIQVIFATGTRGYAASVQAIQALDIDPYTTKGLVVKEYLHHMPEAIAAADLVVGRAGATFLAEISMAGKVGVLIPYPYAAGDHQTANARIYTQHGAAISIADEDLNGQSLIEALNIYLDDKEKRKKAEEATKQLAKPEAAQHILSLITEVLQHGGEAHG